MRELSDLFGANEEPWMEESKCATDRNFRNTRMTYVEWQKLHRETDFFDNKGPYRNEAKKYCGDCPVRLDCQMFATRDRVEEQIYGGLTGRERRAIVRKTNKLLEEWLKLMPEPQQDDESPNAA